MRLVSSSRAPDATNKDCTKTTSGTSSNLLMISPNEAERGIGARKRKTSQLLERRRGNGFSREPSQNARSIDGSGTAEA